MDLFKTGKWFGDDCFQSFKKVKQLKLDSSLVDQISLYIKQGNMEKFKDKLNALWGMGKLK